MKKLLLSTLLGVFSWAVTAQSLVIEQYDSVAYGNAYTTDDIVAYIKVKNVSSNALDVRVKRIDGNFNSLTASNAICWTMCYNTNVSMSPDHITIQPNEVNGNFSGHVYPPMDGVANQGPITYVFFDANNPNDSVAVTVLYRVTQTFSTADIAAGNISALYPNPAKDYFDVEIEAPVNATKSVTITNMVGAAVKQFNLEEMGRKRISTADLPNGVYFVTLKVNNRAVTTKRLVVSH
jgi:hypothetical protein